MGNARFFVARSCPTWKKHRLAYKVLRLGKDIDFEEKKFTWMEESNGMKYWLLGNKNEFWITGKLLHRRDGPAIEWANGVKEWWVEGTIHREDGPAIEYPDGTKMYFIEGKNRSNLKNLKK